MHEEETELCVRVMGLALMAIGKPKVGLFSGWKQTDTQTYRLFEGRRGTSTAFASLLKQWQPLWDPLVTPLSVCRVTRVQVGLLLEGAHGLCGASALTFPSFKK